MNVDVRQAYRALQVFGECNNLIKTHGLFVTQVVEGYFSYMPMFVGRDTRGQIEGFREISNYRVNDLSWLDRSNKYNYSKSPFWRVIGKTLAKIRNKELNICIFSSLIWGNLYKISPQSDEATSRRLKKMQTSLCADLLIKEIHEIIPSSIVFMTGFEIDGFIKEWKMKGLITEIREYKQAKCFDIHYGKDGKLIPAIIIQHPQGKKETPIVNTLSDFISNNSMWSNKRLTGTAVIS